ALVLEALQDIIQLLRVQALVPPQRIVYLIIGQHPAPLAAVEQFGDLRALLQLIHWHFNPLPSTLGHTAREQAEGTHDTLGRFAITFPCPSGLPARLSVFFASRFRCAAHSLPAPGR